MTGRQTFRLDGLEPDNLLAFMALLGLLRALEESRPEWCARVAWSVDESPLRPTLGVPNTVDENALVEAVAEGLNTLAQRHNFGDLVDLKLTYSIANQKLRIAAAHANMDRYTADLWAAFLSDVVTDNEGKTRPTPLCFLGTGNTNFIKTFKSVSLQQTPPRRGSHKKKVEISEYDCLREAMFKTWMRPDRTDGSDKTSAFRWDPNEDVRYAQRWNAPTNNKEPTQHGANRLATIGLSIFAVVPRLRNGKAELAIVGSQSEVGSLYICWPIWREPISLAGIRALLTHPHLYRQQTRSALGIVELRRARRISVGRYINVTRANTVFEQD